MAAKPGIVPADMTLYSPMEPEGRQFLAGEPWPGDAWSDKPGGEPAGANVAAGALKDLIEANDANERLGATIESLKHDLAQANAAKEEALAKVAGLEQAARDAETAKAEAEDIAKGLTTERDQARAAAEKAEGDRKAAEELVESLNAQLSAANQALADAKAEIAKVDGDGDGRVGGSKPKAAKAADAA